MYGDRVLLRALEGAAYPDKTAQDLRRWLAQKLGEYMDAYQYLDRLSAPQEIDGKILSLSERIKLVLDGCGS